MPNIFFWGPKMSKEQKADLAKRFTDAAADVTKIPAQAFIVNIVETDRENVAVGGTLLADRQK